MPIGSRQFLVRARGPLACFERPDCHAERVSYEVMTPLAARGILEAFLWKPAMRWHIESISVLAPIAWVRLSRYKVPTIALRDVDYVIAAYIELVPEKIGPRDNLRKYEEMFARRLARGQPFRAPYLGGQKLFAEVFPGEDAPEPIERGITRALGQMPYGYVGNPCYRVFFEARLESGTMTVPALRFPLIQIPVTPVDPRTPAHPHETTEGGRCL